MKTLDVYCVSEAENHLEQNIIFDYILSNYELIGFNEGDNVFLSSKLTGVVSKQSYKIESIFEYKCINRYGFSKIILKKTD